MPGANEPKLVLTCAQRDSDTLTFRRAGVQLVCEAFDAVMEDGGREEDRTITYLDADRARQLFNWLGVQLHKGGLK